MKKTQCKSCKPLTNPTEQTRRDFLAGMAKAATVLSLSPYLSFGASALARRSLVVVFMRGGADGLSLLPPANNKVFPGNYRIYQDARQGLGLTSTEAKALGNSGFALHPELEPLRELYHQQKLLFLHGVGSPNNTRSHFDQQDLMEFGDPLREARVRTGYLQRALDELQSNLVPATTLPGVSIGTQIDKSLRGGPAIALPQNLAQYATMGASNTVAALSLRERLVGAWKSLPENPNWIDKLTRSAGNLAVDSMDEVQLALQKAKNLTLGTPASYGTLGELRGTCMLLASQPGLRFVTVNAGGWDSHNNMGLLGGAFANNVAGLAKGLKQFALDLEENNLWNSTTVVVMTEFGRRLAANGSEGTDHGRGGVMMVMGGGVLGGQVITKEPGGPAWNLNQLESAGDARASGDVRVTVDYRHVLSEIFNRKFQLSNSKIGEIIFPGFKPKAIGVF